MNVLDRNSQLRLRDKLNGSRPMSAARFSLVVAANCRDAATESGDGNWAGDGTATGTGPATALVTVTGELDATNAAQFIAEVGRVAAERATVLDLSGLLYVDSAGFAALHQSLNRPAVILRIVG